MEVQFHLLFQLFAASKIPVNVEFTGILQGWIVGLEQNDRFRNVPQTLKAKGEEDVRSIQTRPGFNSVSTMPLLSFSQMSDGYNTVFIVVCHQLIVC